jgi:hypothetical protein
VPAYKEKWNGGKQRKSAVDRQNTTAKRKSSVSSSKVQRQRALSRIGGGYSRKSRKFAYSGRPKNKILEMAQWIILHADNIHPLADFDWMIDEFYDTRWQYGS